MQAVAKALGDLASDTCPLRDVALSAYLGKLLTQLKRCLQVWRQELVPENLLKESYAWYCCMLETACVQPPTLPYVQSMGAMQQPTE